GQGIVGAVVTQGEAGDRSPAGAHVEGLPAFADAVPFQVDEEAPRGQGTAGGAGEEADQVVGRGHRLAVEVGAVAVLVAQGEAGTGAQTEALALAVGRGADAEDHPAVVVLEVVLRFAETRAAAIVAAGTAGQIHADAGSQAVDPAGGLDLEAQTQARL